MKKKLLLTLSILTGIMSIQAMERNEEPFSIKRIFNHTNTDAYLVIPPQARGTEIVQAKATYVIPAQTKSENVVTALRPNETFNLVGEFGATWETAKPNMTIAINKEFVATHVA